LKLLLVVGDVENPEVNLFNEVKLSLLG